VYGEPLRIPGEFLTQTAHPVEPAHHKYNVWFCRAHSPPPQITLSNRSGAKMWNGRTIIIIIIIIIIINGSRAHFGTWSLFSVYWTYIVGGNPWVGDEPVARPLPTHRAQTQNKRTQTSMLDVGFEPTTSSLRGRRQFIY
jgi:hypothetical protein